MNVDQRSPCMVSIIVEGTLFLYHLLAWKSCTLSRSRCQCLKRKLTRRIHNLLQLAFDPGWAIMTGTRVLGLGLPAIYRVDATMVSLTGP